MARFSATALASRRLDKEISLSSAAPTSGRSIIRRVEAGAQVAFHNPAAPHPLHLAAQVLGVLQQQKAGQQFNNSKSARCAQNCMQQTQRSGT